MPDRVAGVRALEPAVQVDVDRVWEAFWAPLVAPRGAIRVVLAKRELYDYYRVMVECVRLAEVCGVEASGVGGLHALVDHVAELRRRADELGVLEAKMRAVESSAEALLLAGRLTRRGYRELLDREPGVAAVRGGG